MSICNVVSGGITRGCDSNVGGIRRAWFGNFENIDTVTHGSPTRSITNISLVNAANKLQLFEFKKNTSNYVENEAPNEDGETLVTQLISLVFSRREQSKRDVLVLLGKGKPDLSCIVEDSNGKYFLFGETNGVNLTANEGGSGTVKTDRNGYAVTFTGEEPELASEINTSFDLSTILDDF